MEINPRAHRNQRRGRRHCPTVLAIALGTLLSAGPPALGKDPSASEFLHLSQAIFRGRVVESKSFANTETGDILTRYLFQVDETLKGQKSDLFEIIEYGGTLGDHSMVVPHGANYQEGAEYLVFAWRDALGRGRTLAGCEGGLPLVTDSGGSLAVRLGPGHPLKSITGPATGFFVDFQSLAQTIIAANEASSKQ